MSKKSFEALPVQNKKVLVRVDYNVPIKDGQVSDDTRIRESLPTLKKLLEQKASVILCSHLGRPKGAVNLKYSLEPVAKKLEQLLGGKVSFAKDCVGPEARNVVSKIQPSQVALLENLRFHPEEEKNAEPFAKELAGLADYFVQDAFGAVHRAHASTSGVAKFLPNAAGFLLQKEIQVLGKLLTNPEKPFVTILGGAKVSDKIEVIQNLLKKADSVIIGGGMSYTFLKAKGAKIGKSLLEEDKVELAKSLLSNPKLQIPVDHVITEKIESGAKTQITSDENIPDGWIGVDIGPKTAQRIAETVSKAKTIFWNGPVGIFEIPEFSQGTLSCAKAIAAATQKGAFSVVGGGDSIAAINQSGMAKQISHISTGGGASLEFLEGKSLPGVEALANG